jgi:hypothetical protein
MAKVDLPGASVNKDKRKQRIRGMRRAPDAAINVRGGNTERGANAETIPSPDGRRKRCVPK